MNAPLLDRRGVLTGGALVVAFAMASRLLGDAVGGGEGGAGPKVVRPDLDGSLKTNPWLDAWIRIDAQGKATVCSGKAELGQGIRTALLQVVAEELDMPPASITFITADTGRTPDEGLTAGSHSMQDSGTALANAGANVRMLLMSAAAKRLGVGTAELDTTGDGHIVAPDGKRISYGEAASSLSLHVEAVANAPRRSPQHYRTMNRDFQTRRYSRKADGRAGLRPRPATSWHGARARHSRPKLRNQAHHSPDCGCAKDAGSAQDHTERPVSGRCCPQGMAGYSGHASGTDKRLCENGPGFARGAWPAAFAVAREP